MKPSFQLALVAALLSIIALCACQDPGSGGDPLPKETVATPAFAVSTGKYSSGQLVHITCGTEDAEIHCTVNDTAPTSSSPAYDGKGISVAGDHTVVKIRAIATKSGMLDSAEAEVTITINYSQVSTPRISPPGGTYQSAQNVAIDCGTADAAIRYTTDGSDPGPTHGAVYDGTVSISANCSLKAFAHKSGMSDSTIASADYEFTPAAPSIADATPGLHTVTIAWSAVDGATSYAVYYGRGQTVSAADGTKLAVAGTATQAEVPELKGGKTYSFIVTASNASGESLASSAAQCVPEAQWSAIGGAGFSAQKIHAPSLAVDSKNVPYIAYFEEAPGTGQSILLVKKLSGGAWTSVGDYAFPYPLPSPTPNCLSLAIGPDDAPYVACPDRENGSRATVKKFNGSSWETVGSAGFSAGEIAYVSLAFDSTGSSLVPYVGYQDYYYANEATVMRLNGSSWEAVGNTGFSDTRADYFSMIIGPGEVPFVALCGSNAKARALKFDAAGGTWGAAAASLNVSQGVGYDTSIMASKGVPYMVFCDYSSLKYQTKVVKYGGTSWEAVGPELAVSVPTYMPIAFDSKDDVYICWSDINREIGTTVKKLDASGTAWNAIGAEKFSPGAVTEVRFIIDRDDVPIVAFVDGANGGKATVMAYE
jgi:hypothetical protein